MFILGVKNVKFQDYMVCINVEHCLFLLSWARNKQILYENMSDIDTAAANVDADISLTLDHLVVLVPHQHHLCGGHLHPGLHLLAGIEVRAATHPTSAAANHFSQSF